MSKSDEAARAEVPTADGRGRNETRSSPSAALPALVAFLVLAVAALTAHEVSLREDAVLRRNTALALAHVISEVEGELEDQISALVRMAGRWADRGTQPRDGWEADARRYLDHYAAIQAIEYVDASLHVRGIVPLEGNESMQGLDLGFEERRRSALEQARDRREAAVTRPVELVQGGAGFLVHAPIFATDEFRGFIVGVYRFEALLGPILRNAETGYAIEILDENTPLFTRGTSGPQAPDWKQAAIIGPETLGWRVEMIPGPEPVASAQTLLPGSIALSGLAVATLLGGTIHFARLARWRARRSRADYLSLRAESERRENAEDALRQSHAELSRVMESISDYLWSAEFHPDEGFNYRFYSPVVEQITGRPPSFYMKGPDRWLSTIHPDDRDRMGGLFRKAVKGGLDAVTEEYRIVMPDGSIRWLRGSVKLTQLEDRRRRVDGVVTDLTEQKLEEQRRRSLERAMQHSQKFESLGVLAGGAAHDFNNLLVVILGHADLALEATGLEAPMRHHLEAVVGAARRAAELCVQMLAYAGRARFETETVDLGRLIAEMRPLLESSISRNAKLSCELASGVLALDADPTQLRQIVMNLVINASEAIGDSGGSIVVSISARDCDRETLKRSYVDDDLPAGTYVCLEVSDDGCGMDEETRARVFEPFFTTRMTGRGLGLASVLGLVRSHRGAIEVESSRGEGTRVRVLFPATLRSPCLDAAVPAPDSEWSGRGTILLVDDEEIVRKASARMLERLGFDVRPVADGQDAVALFRAEPEAFVCVLLDRTMPGMDGEETCKQLLRIRPGVPVIISSGYGLDADHGLADCGASDFLDKPYTLEKLRHKLRDVLS